MVHGGRVGRRPFFSAVMAASVAFVGGRAGRRPAAVSHSSAACYSHVRTSGRLWLVAQSLPERKKSAGVGVWANGGGGCGAI